MIGVRSGRLTRHVDERGAFRELWRASAFGVLDPADVGARVRAGAPSAAGGSADEPRFVQANLSSSTVGVLRGLHYHRRQLDYWIVTAGRAFVALVDVRPVVAGSGGPQVETFEMIADDWAVIPAGVAHGFLALEQLDMLYLVTNEYDGSDELGFAWDDPAVGVRWPRPLPTPDGLPVLSARDRSNPTLEELVRSLASSG